MTRRFFLTYTIHFLLTILLAGCPLVSDKKNPASLNKSSTKKCKKEDETFLAKKESQEKKASLDLQSEYQQLINKLLTNEEHKPWIPNKWKPDVKAFVNEIHEERGVDGLRTVLHGVEYLINKDFREWEHHECVLTRVFSTLMVAVVSKDHSLLDRTLDLSRHYYTKIVLHEAYEHKTIELQELGDEFGKSDFNTNLTMMKKVADFLGNFLQEDGEGPRTDAGSETCIDALSGLFCLMEAKVWGVKQYVLTIYEKKLKDKNVPHKNKVQIVEEFWLAFCQDYMLVSVERGSEDEVCIKKTRQILKALVEENNDLKDAATYELEKNCKAAFSNLSE